MDKSIMSYRNPHYSEQLKWYLTGARAATAANGYDATPDILNHGRIHRDKPQATMELPTDPDKLRIFIQRTQADLTIIQDTLKLMSRHLKGRDSKSGHPRPPLHP